MQANSELTFPMSKELAKNVSLILSLELKRTQAKKTQQKGEFVSQRKRKLHLTTLGQRAKTK
jgi:hypothetical protein